MSFSQTAKLKAFAIVNIFETSQPFGDYAACTVLNDGAGVSYGISQFTHKSGSLAAVVEAYLNNGGKIGTEILKTAFPTLKRKTVSAIKTLASDEQFKKALRAAAVTHEMKAAQQQITAEKYLEPALEICVDKGFILPLSLAVVFDSLIHGSWKKISRNAGILPASQTGEKAWVTNYVRKRHAWLLSIDRLKTTSYRTKFFLNQIAIGNWNLRLPILVHGFKLTDAFFPLEAEDVEPQKSADVEKGILTSAGEIVSATADKFDRVDRVVTTVTSRKDAVKSLWTTVIGTIWQMLWAVFGFLAGLPKEVWILVAVVAALLMILYLYRQIELGRIREKLKSEI
ncbi:MAG: chitosanase [Pyrinomonadaceae bacterium]